MPRKTKHHFKKNSLKSTLKTFTCWMIALALIPFLFASIKSFLFLFPLVASLGFQSWWVFLGGAFSYFVLDKWIHKPMWFYVMGHELTHAISGLLSGAKVHSIKVHSEKGEVRLSKTNAFIALSPYIFPFYTGLVILVYAVITKWWTHSYLTMGFQFFVGFTLAFHFLLTLDSFHKSQPDLKILGLFLSGVLVGIGNSLVGALLLIGLFKGTPNMTDYAQVVWDDTAHIWGHIHTFIVTEAGPIVWKNN